MARVLPIGAAEGAALAGRPLVRTLATLPDEWTLLLDRCIGGASGRYVEAVLVHAEIGVALVEQVPRDASLGRATLCGLLERERFADYFPGDLPIVALSAAAESPAAISAQLAAAFGAASRLSIADPDWAYAFIDLLLQPDPLDATPTEEPADAAEAEPIFRSPRAMEILRVSSKTATTVRVEIGRPEGDTPSPYSVELIPVAPRGLPSSSYTLPLPARSGLAVAAAWSGAVAAIGAMVWVLGYSVEREPGLDVASPAEIAMTAVAPSAAAEPDAVIAAEPVATAAQSAPAVDASAPRAAAEVAGGAAARRAASRHSAGIGARHVRCADWLHQNRPGGSDYHGPRVAKCSPPR